MTPEVSTASARDLRLQALLQDRLNRTAARSSTIPRRTADGPAPLAPMQESVWLLQQMAPGGAAYHRPTAFQLSGPLDRRALQLALDDLVVRHESLRSTVHLIDGELRQRVEAPSPVPFAFDDVSRGPNPERTALELAKAAALEPINLEQGPMVRARLFRTSETEHLLVLQLHHLTIDGWSEGALRADLASAYSARLHGGAPDMEPLKVQMGDIAAWQDAARRDGTHEAGLEYWRRQLEDMPTTLDLPTDRPRAGVSASTAIVAFEIPADLADRARGLARDETTTLYGVLLAAYQTLLFRYARQTDFAVGTPVAGRSHVEMEGVVGCLINLLVLRARLDGQASFRSHLGEVRRTVLEALRHQQVPLSDVVSASFPDRNSFEPVYPTLFQLRNFPDTAVEGPLSIHPVHVTLGESEMDLSLDGVDGGAGNAVRCRMSYRTDLFDVATVERMAEHFLRLLEAVVADPDQALGRLSLMGPEERHFVLDEVQVPRIAPLELGGIQELVERRAAHQPDAPALIFGDEVWTLGQLNTRANQLAWRLKALGVGPGVPVVLGFGRSPQLNMAVLAVLKAGGAYVPVDVGYPEARLRTILEGVGAPLLLVRGGSPWPDLDDMPDLQVFDVDALDLEGESQTNPSTDGLSPDRPAYMLYTSGSTGEPKGVVITQANLLAAAPGWEEVYRLGELDAFVETARPTFDVYSEAWIRSLGYGLKLVHCPRDFLLDPRRFVQLLRENKVDAISSVPAVYRLLTTYLEETGQHLDSVRFAVVGADVWRPDDHARLQTVMPNACVMNSYGITEVTVSNTYFVGESPRLPSGSVPIGKAYPNSLLYVLDTFGEPVPVGVPGELYIGGPVVGGGYLGRPNLTAERFLPDPFSDEPGARMYRSGDLVRWLPSGDLDFLGRTDFQVKVRGFRIELGEIESVLMGHPSVVQAVVTVQRGERDDDALIAHVVPASGASVDLDDLRVCARRQLADYMVPTSFAVHDQFPLSDNGKVDRRALADRTVAREERPLGEPPRTEVEIGLAEIWVDVLGVETVSRGDSFFDLGGHSLRAMQVLARVQQRWGVALGFHDLVEAPCLTELAGRIQAGGAPDDPTAAGRHIIKLGGTEGTPPILIVHGIEANPLPYIALARHLSTDHAVYGTQGFGLDGGEVAHASVEEIAETYAEEWMELGVNGPVTLVGLCYGSVLALELARQLEARGADVEAYVSINQTELPYAKTLRGDSATDRVQAGIRSVRGGIGRHIRRALWGLHQRAEPGGWLANRLEQSRYVQGALTFERDRAVEDQIVQIGQMYASEARAGGTAHPVPGGVQDAVEAYVQMRVREAYRERYDAYRGGAFGGRMVLLLTEAHQGETLGRVLGACVSNVEIRTFAGPHAPLTEPHVQDLAAELSEIATGAAS